MPCCCVRRVAMLLPTRQLTNRIFLLLLLLTSQTAAVKRMAHIELEAGGCGRRSGAAHERRGAAGAGDGNLQDASL